MSSRLFTIRFFLLFTISYLSAYILYIIVNPEQKFDSSITKLKFFYTKEYSKKQFEYLKENKCMLVFGTSQTHMISSEMVGNKVLNFHNLYGEADDILNFLHQLNKKQLGNITNVIFLIDLRAGAVRRDSDLIDYNNSFSIPTLDMNSIDRIFLDIAQNYIYPINSYLNRDGSIKYLNDNEHIKIKHINTYSRALLKYDERLIDKIIEINNLLKANHIKTTIITPVVNDVYIKSIDFSDLSYFFASLLNKGVDNIGLYYYIDGISNIKNNDNEYVSFIEQEHLNPHFVKKWLFEYILTKNKYLISNEKELALYINEMKKIQTADK